MNNDTTMLNFVKTKLEENEGISSAVLKQLLDVANDSQATRRSAFRNWHRAACLLAASLAVAVCGWFFLAAPDRSHDGDLSDVIELLRVADGDSPCATASLADNLLAWQDSPSLADEAATATN